MKLLKALLLITVLSLLVLGCEQGEEFQQPPAPDEQPTRQNDTQEEEERDQRDQVSAREELKDLLDTEPTFQATYEVVSTAEGETRTATETVTIKGENSKREFQSESFYILDDKVYLCQSQEGTKCYEIPQEKPPKPINVSIPENVTVTKAGARTIAGVEAECYSLEGPGQSATDCRSDDGILLYFHRVEDKYEVELTAQSVERNVPDSVFELPAEPQPFDPDDFGSTTTGQSTS